MVPVRLLIDITPLRVSVAYRRMWAGVSLSGISTQLSTVAVGLQVYDITGSTFDVGLVGVFALVPLVVMGLYGGALADAHDRRRVILTTSVGLLVVAAAFAAQAWAQVGSVALLYALVAAQNACYAVNSAGRTATIPRLLPPHLLPAANALGSMSRGLAFTTGPVLAGLLVGWWGYGGAYSIEVVLLGTAVLSLRALPQLPPTEEPTHTGLRSVLEGLRYLRTRPNLRMTFFLDLAAMVLAMPRVLFPAIGAAVIGGGATTVGLLGGALAGGTFLAGMFSGPLGQVRRQGLAVVGAVICWGLAIAAFGVVVAMATPEPSGAAGWALWPAMACLILAGGADAVSAVFRMTILQAATPDALRGRLQGVFVVVVAGGPRLGDLTLGTVGEASSEAVAAIAGGLACVGVVLVLVLLQRRFMRYDAHDPTP